MSGDLVAFEPAHQVPMEGHRPLPGEARADAFPAVSLRATVPSQ